MVAAVLIGGGSFAAMAHAADCSDPALLGTSRTLIVDPLEHPLVGTMQYPETLPLEDHEVVLTFDDGPIPAHTNPVLDTLAAQCVKATFFLVGEMSKAFPATVRRIRDEGHTIGTHSQTHPLNLDRMPLDEAKAQIDDGITNAATALGNPNEVAPFFRVPGLLRSQPVEDYLASRGLMTWSADFPADDWHRISGPQVVKIAMRRLEAHGKGILLLHDIHARTQAALPVLLKELKDNGFRVVHVIPASAEHPKTPTEPGQWLMHPMIPPMAASDWPAIPASFTFSAKGEFPAPLMTADDARTLEPPPRHDEPRQTTRRGVPLVLASIWPKPDEVSYLRTGDQFPAPDIALFTLNGGLPEDKVQDAKDIAETTHRTEDIPPVGVSQKSAEATPQAEPAKNDVR
jgi:peptidoglycan/xylan/chitin deacetylase (PgdA/CDA1 family)